MKKENLRLQQLESDSERSLSSDDFDFEVSKYEDDDRDDPAPRPSTFIRMAMKRIYVKYLSYFSY